MKVIKRDGRVVDYDSMKIILAMKKANNEVPVTDQITDQKMEDIERKISEMERKQIQVEEIQDLIEHSLVQEQKYELAKKYIIYRYKHALVRKANTTDESILSLIRNDNKELAEENSNKNTLLASTQRDYIAGEVSRDLTKRVLLPDKIVKAHESGAIHFLDAEYFLPPMFKCFLIHI
ncbi:MAG: anaerobic ribonucleoside-triphosphate reductase, partial [Eubacterium sp.]|nr:anaerobic ribonucleoside-triphosphate reductase [Eubacterium sp.]